MGRYKDEGGASGGLPDATASRVREALLFAFC